jgi:uncharacterized repeat protein (TIGR03803 family)
MKHQFAKTLFIVVLFTFSALPPVHAQINFTNLHSFNDTNDGNHPLAGLVLQGNTLYGTTYTGGSLSNGTVFAVHTDGTSFTNLYSFGGTNGGANPYANLIISGNTLYGTTRDGGSSSNGTVFAINTDGTGYTNLHSFTASSTNSSGLYTNSDGANPYTRLILSGNSLYGTAYSGGSLGFGTVFAINTDGTGFTNLYSFTGLSTGLSEGAYPQAGLILSGNTLYGTTDGEGFLNGAPVAGTIFAINTDGTGFTNLYTFGGINDGGNPEASLVLSGNTLYGTTLTGGSFNEGTVFAINTNGTSYTNLYSFSFTNSDGALPQASLILSGNTLYGTASEGGGFGNGTVFAINTDGAGFTNLYNFTARIRLSTNSDGALPRASLILSGNTLYGTASGGGSFNDGTVFALSLPVPSLALSSIGNQIILSWPTSAANFNLQTSPDFFNWSNLTNGMAIVGGNYVFTNTVNGQSAFFRLQSQ